jgi:hypothetical protein
MKFNLLIPDPQSPFAYAVIQCLKEFCGRIYVCATPGTFFSKISCPSSYSRYVGEVFFAESPFKDWGGSFYRKENTPREERFLSQLLDFCERRSVNLIYPVSDPAIYLFSKNIERFKALGIEVPVPEYSKFIFMMDKFACTRLAEEHGISCPRTFLLKEGSLDEIISTLKFPAVIKPRFGMGGIGVHKCADRQELLSKYKNCSAGPDEMILQEYIPISRMTMVDVYMDRESRPLAHFCYKVERPDRRIFYLRMGANELTGPNESLYPVISLLKDLKFSGFANAQFRVDSRDNTPKFLEMNIKMSGSTWMEMRLGVNRPLFNYYVYTGKEIPPLKYRYPEGVFFLSPVEDGMTLLVYLFCWFIKYTLRYCFFRYRNNPLENIPALKEMIGDYRHKYTRKDAEFNFYFTGFLKDPLVSLVAWIFYFYKLITVDFPESFLE